ncbi:hypothetical protein, partial [Streptomyces hebeiensis]
METTSKNSEAQDSPLGSAMQSEWEEGPNGERLRRRWALSGYRAPAWGNAEFENTFLPDDGTPDGQVEHKWHENPGLPTY